MTEVFVVSDNILSPLGTTTAANFSRLKNAETGVQSHVDPDLSGEQFCASLFAKDQQFLSAGENVIYSKFEQLLISSITDALQHSEVDITDEKTGIIISTTKGNIGLLENRSVGEADLAKRIALHTSAGLVAAYFNNNNQPLIVSNACISGLLAILTGKRLIESGRFENVVVAGADVISKFVLSGFQSFQAVSNEPCKPFDISRKGINLGEGAATILLSSNNNIAKHGIKIAGGSVSNDANHISGPSRTGEELHQAIRSAIKEANISAKNIDFISAHGTATIFNDEMEAKAISLAGLSTVPVNSLKGYFGHTLGAAGLIESIIAAQSLKTGIILPSLGFSTIGVTKPINICNTLLSGAIYNCLKTASGFGGCNAALVISKN